MGTMSPSVFQKMANAWFNSQLQLLMQQAGSPQDLMSLAIRTNSTGKYEDYAWLGDVPAVKQLTGPKTARDLADYSYQLRNRAFYAAINVRYEDLRDDQIGAYEQRIRDLATRMAQYWRQMIRDLLVNGHITTSTYGAAWDGGAFFANSRLKGASFDNLLDGDGTDTVAHVMTTMDAVIAAMMAFADEEGVKLNIQPDTVVCAPAAWRTVATALGSTADASGSNAAVENPFKRFNFSVIPDASISDANDLYVLAAKGSLKPFIFQEREGMQSLFDDSKRKSDRIYQYSVEWDGMTGYGLPQLAIKVVNT